jgi:hypothetical protein
MRNIEHNIQVACVTWFRYQYSDHLIYAIPNGGLRNKAVAGKLKAEGVLRGIPDLCIPVARFGSHGLYIEMKAENETTKPHQDLIISKLRDEGYQCEVVHSFDEFQKIVNEYFD